MNGWPLSTHASATISTNQTWCTDRAKVTAMSVGSGARSLTLANFEGSFTQGDWVMVIQMHEGINFTGKYTLCEVTSTGTTSSPATSINVQPYVGGPYSNTWRGFTLNNINNDLIQIVKVQRYWNLTVSGGIITCPAFDFSKGTGGILCVMVGNDFNMTGGYFNTHAKGFHVTFNSAGGKLGQGGIGATPSTSHSPTGQCLGSNPGSVNKNLNPNYSTLQINQSSPILNGEPGAILKALPGTSIPIYTSQNGQIGGPANNPNTAGTNTSPFTPYIFGHSNFGFNDLHLGCSGRCGLASASGGGGGGFGGPGGNFNTNIGGPTGNTGLPGESGKKGGNAGEAGIGGGIIYIKVANSNLNFPNNQIRFIASASNGGNGGKGGDGGKGGKGGFGAAGTCNGSTLVTSGGIGGFGDGGKGGDGADGGTGGCGGTIWILKKNGGTHIGAFGNYSFNNAGIGGIGGEPGYKYTYLRTPRPINYSPKLSTLACNPGSIFSFGSRFSTCPPKVCDCDEVYRHLGADMAGNVTYTNTSATTWRINSIPNPSQAPVFWDGTGILSYTKINGTCSTLYECKMKRNSTFIEFMDKVFGSVALESYNGLGNLNSGLMATAMNGLKTRLFSLNGHLMYEYDPATKRLTDYDDLKNPYVDVDACDETHSVIKDSIAGGIGSGGGGSQDENPKLDDIPIIGVPNGNRGANGANFANGAFMEIANVSAPPMDNTNDDGSLKEIAGINTDFNILATPNNITIENLNHQLGDLFIYNTLGKMVYNGTITLENNTIELSAGTYILNFIYNNKNYKTKVLINDH